MMYGGEKTFSQDVILDFYLISLVGSDEFRVYCFVNFIYKNIVLLTDCE
jgi:hypothetical protein